MNIVITRQQSSETGTPGDLLVTDTGFICKTLELEWNDNDPNTSCIEADTYTGNIYFSPHLQRDVILLENKNSRTNIEIHNGNFAGQTAEGEVAQVSGCTLVGDGYGQIPLPKGGSQFGITNSVNTLNALLANIGTGAHTITYQWQAGFEPT